MSLNKNVYIGSFVSSASLGNLNVLEGFVCVEDGLITLTGSKPKFFELEKSGCFKNFNVTLLRLHELMIPGFVDCHTHAAQFPNLGVGLDRPLLEWLDKYTFPMEKQYSDVEFATKVYDSVVRNLVRNGTTTACYFGSLHLEGTIQLAYAALKHRQRALVGKVSMNIKNDAGYYNNTETELIQSEKFVKFIRDNMDSLVEPIVTPRFAVSCDEELMRGLSAIAEKYNCRIQSHISENRKEIEHVLCEFPKCNSYSDVYDKCGLLNNRCIMAHAVHLSTEEMKVLAARGVSVAHCPASNTRLRSGMCPVRELIHHGVTVGLGTDVSGGDSLSILDAMRRTMDVSTHLDLMNGTERALDWKAAFHLATLGGAKALKLEDKIGDFQVGKEFDAIRVHINATDSPIADYSDLRNKTDEITLSMLQRFIHSGDKTNIREVYVRGMKVYGLDPDSADENKL